MADPFLGEIRPTSWGFAAKGWALCNGQLLPIAQNQALFSLLGTMYGGDGRTTFALPDLRGRVPLHRGQNQQGQSYGEENHTLNYSEMPMHTHTVNASTNAADTGGPQDAFWASQSGQNPFTGTANAKMWDGAIAPSGNSQPHPNMAPYLTISFMIALVGIYPSRD
ncbi:phage tail protein [Kouleothrix aurantiaca]|jgi:microcystin-dependent protein|uniref:Phage tail protein n=1 Tax=Kouleothrix aurantiaca TaxID=186479 RepID=A0A0P9D7T1_9CHLR|nr:phage tail protein [Kouleothrix aurantiaca]